MAESETQGSSIYDGESVPTYGQTTSSSERSASAAKPLISGAEKSPPKAKWRYHNLDSPLLEFLAFLAENSVQVIRIEDIAMGNTNFGTGQTMRVVSGRLNGQDVAVKFPAQNEFKPGYTTEESDAIEHPAKAFQQLLQNLMFEIRIMRHPQLRNHPNIVRLHAVAFQDGVMAMKNHQPSSSMGETAGAARSDAYTKQEIFFPVLVLEPASKSHPDLAAYFKAYTEQYYSSEMIDQLICDIAMGLSALHQLGITHGDVKDENILLFDDTEGRNGGFVAKVADFGAAGIDTAREPTRGLSRYWAAPEALERPSGWEGLRLTPEADVYSFGILAATIALRGTKVFDAVDSYKLKMKDEAAKHILTQLGHFQDGGMAFANSIREVVSRTVVLDRKKRLRDLSVVPKLLGRKAKHMNRLDDAMVPFHSYGTLAHSGIPPLASTVAGTIYDQLPQAVKKRMADLVHDFLNASTDTQTMLVHIAERMKGEPSLLDSSDDLVRRLLAIKLLNGDDIDQEPVPLEVDMTQVGGFMQMYMRDIVLGGKEEPKVLKAVRESDNIELHREILRDSSVKRATVGMGWTGLHYCAFFNRPNLMDAFLEGDNAVFVDATAGQAPEFTPLHIAAQEGNHECVRRLIDHHAKVNARTMAAGDFSMTPLQLGVLGGRNISDDDVLKTIAMLLGAGSSVDFRYRGLGVAHCLCQTRGGAKALRLFLNHTPSLISQLTPNRQTPLHSATGSRNLAAVELLLERRAVVDARNVAGDRPLHNAYMSMGPATRLTSRRFSPQFVRRLAGDEADAEKIIRLLIEAGADEDAVGMDGIPWDTPEFRRYDEDEDASEFTLSPWKCLSFQERGAYSRQWSFPEWEAGEFGTTAVFERGQDKLMLDFALPKTTPNHYEVQIRVACLDEAVQGTSITVLVYHEKDDYMAARVALHRLDVGQAFTIKMRDFVVKHTTDLKMRVYEEATPGRGADGPRRGKLLLDWIRVSKFNVMTVVGSSTCSNIPDLRFGGGS